MILGWPSVIGNHVDPRVQKLRAGRSDRAQRELALARAHHRAGDRFLVAREPSGFPDPVRDLAVDPHDRALAVALDCLLVGLHEDILLCATPLEGGARRGRVRSVDREREPRRARDRGLHDRAVPSPRRPARPRACRVEPRRTSSVGTVGTPRACEVEEVLLVEVPLDDRERIDERRDLRRAAEPSAERVCVPRIVPGRAQDGERRVMETARRASSQASMLASTPAARSASSRSDSSRSGSGSVRQVASARSISVPRRASTPIASATPPPSPVTAVRRPKRGRSRQPARLP